MTPREREAIAARERKLALLTTVEQLKTAPEPDRVKGEHDPRTTPYEMARAQRTRSPK